jgi:hypothetical protein
VGLGGLVIYELMASIVAALEDPDGAGLYPDWIEVYNGTGRGVDLGGMFLTDDPKNLTRWQIPAGTTLSDGGHAVVFADNRVKEGKRHANFELKSGGEFIALVDRDGETIIDRIVFDMQFEDISFGRSPDGGAAWGYQQAPTPGAANGPLR